MPVGGGSSSVEEMGPRKKGQKGEVRRWLRKVGRRGGKDESRETAQVGSETQRRPEGRVLFPVV